MITTHCGCMKMLDILQKLTGVWEWKLDMLEEAGFFEETNTVEEMAVVNFMKTVLHKLEIYGDVRNNAMVINRMFDIPIRKEIGWLKRNLRKLRKQKR